MIHCVTKNGVDLLLFPLYYSPICVLDILFVNGSCLIITGSGWCRHLSLFDSCLEGKGGGAGGAGDDDWRKGCRAADCHERKQSCTLHCRTSNVCDGM